MKPYPDVNPQPKFPQIEEAILQFWKEQKIFEKSVEARSGEEFVFYDGPPFANGLPHYGHLLTGFVKDVVPRYQTMRGKKVERRFGWDCHGLPAEIEAEKEIGVSGRRQITDYGIDKFNSQCRHSVLRYTKEWENYVTRQARWVDFDNDYKTMDLSYMESVLWAFKQLYQKGLVYEGYRVVPYSWACETPLSNFEIRLDNATRPRQDPAVTVMLELEPLPNDSRPLRLLIWTTTPWTLPANLAVAVGSDLEYALMEEHGVGYVIGSATLEKYQPQLAAASQIGTIKGSDLIGRRYKPLFPYFKETANSFRVLGGDFVTTEEGTGIVHMAPGFGEDDQKLCEANGIPIVCPVDERGCFTAEVTDFAGQQVFEANKQVIHYLKTRKLLVKHESYVHNYPHCWRTDTPIIYKAVSSWYVKVSEFRDRMAELNQQINWIPEHIRDGQFGKWLGNARDWSISRNRFWGTPIPVWKSTNPEFPRIDVYGSLDEIERDFGIRPNDLHRPGIDQLTRPNPDDPSGKSLMQRVDQVLDCWFESGSMPFAQIHYPFENKQWFENHFPADFIVEYVAQTRGWFYTLMVLGTALFDRPPFLNCICHGVVLDENGQKLSKRLRNYPSPEEICNSVGADALRWFLISSPILRGMDLQIDREGKAISEVIRSIINPIWNAYYFFTLYANADQIRATASVSSSQLLDRYILAKIRDFLANLTELLDQYNLAGACAEVVSFLEALNNWFIRRSRDRFWKDIKDQDKLDAYNTLYTVLTTFCRAIAPLLPLISEEVYRGLSGDKSVHLTDWPDHNSFPQDAELVAVMDQVRDICSAGLSIREANNLRTRLPLAKLTVAGNFNQQLPNFVEIIAEELNVKNVELLNDFSKVASLVPQVNARELGPKLGSQMKELLNGIKSGNWSLNSDGSLGVGSLQLSQNEFTLKLIPKEGVPGAALPDNEVVVILDTNLTEELKNEGLARDLIRLIQQGRKDFGLHISDRINLSLTAPDKLIETLNPFQGYIAEQTLAKTISFAQTLQEQSGQYYSQEVQLQDHKVTIGISKSSR